MVGSIRASRTSRIAAPLVFVGFGVEDKRLGWTITAA
jgi:hypothetical protein